MKGWIATAGFAGRTHLDGVQRQHGGLRRRRRDRRQRERRNRDGGEDEREAGGSRTRGTAERVGIPAYSTRAADPCSRTPRTGRSAPLSVGESRQPTVASAEPPATAAVAAALPRQAVAGGGGRVDVGEVAGDARGEQRPRRPTAQEGGQRQPVQSRLARAQARRETCEAASQTPAPSERLPATFDVARAERRS